MRSQEEVKERLRRAREKEKVLVKSRDEHRAKSKGGVPDITGDYWSTLWELNLVRAELQVLKSMLSDGS